MLFNRTNWNRTCFKTYYEKRSFRHLLELQLYLVIHILLFSFYTTIYQLKRGHSSGPCSEMRQAQKVTVRSDTHNTRTNSAAVTTKRAFES
jgi:hypothetical protein